MKKIIAICLVLFLVFGLVACTGGGPTTTPAPPAGGGGGETTPAAPPAGQIQRFVFSASNPGGTWYTKSGGLITWFNQELSHLYAMDMRASGGSVENTRRMALGEVDFAIAYDYHMFEAHTGTGIMEGRPSDVGQFMFFINGQGASFVTLQGNNIETVSDLEGMRVSLGSPGSGTSDNSRRVLQALGIYDSITTSEAGFGDSARALQDGLVDAIGVGGHPASGVVELAATNDILVVPFTQDELDTILHYAPYYSLGVLPAGIYRGQDEEVMMPWFSNFIVVSREVPEQVVYDALTVFFSEDGLAFLASVHRNFETMAMGEEASERLGVPFHAGAIAFFDGHPEFK